jgi:hypothetical protein
MSDITPVEYYKKLGKGEELKVRMSKFVLNWKRLEIKSVLKKITYVNLHQDKPLK